MFKNPVVKNSVSKSPPTGGSESKVEFEKTVTESLLALGWYRTFRLFRKSNLPFFLPSEGICGLLVLLFLRHTLFQSELITAEEKSLIKREMIVHTGKRLRDTKKIKEIQHL